MYQAQSLSKKVIKGGLWIFALRITNRGLGFVRTIILARLLLPEDFGLLGIAMLAVSTLDSFSQTGFQSALVQKRGDIRYYLDVAWTTLAIRGIFLFALLFVSAPFIAKFFNSSQAELIIMVVAVNMLVTGFGNIGVVYFQKEMEFNKQFVYELSATLVDLVVSISLAFILQNVWALIWGGLAKNITRLFLSYLIHPYRPRFRLDREKFRDLFGFGIWISGSTILIFLITQGDDIFVGKVLGIAALGFYQMAYLISNLPSTEIADVISRVTFPAYSVLQDNVTRLREAYLKVLQITAYISIPLAAGIFVLGGDFTRIFLGQKWISMVPALRVLAMAGLFTSISATTKPIFQGMGKPRIDTAWQIIRLLVLITIIYPFSVKWNIFGTAIAVLISTVLATAGFTFMAVKLTECSPGSFAKMTLLPLVNAVMMVLFIMLVRVSFEHVGIWQFCFLAGIGCAVYLVISYVMERYMNYGILGIAKQILNSV